MTVSSTTSRNEYNGNGTTDTFAYTFRILDQAHIAVYVGDVLKTITTDYTITGVGVSGGGSVIFTTAPATGTANVIFLRAVPLTQETDYVENDPFPAESHEDALDKLTMIVQQQQEKIDRTLQLPVTGTFSNVAVPSPSAGKALLWNGTEDALINSTDNFDDIVTNATVQATAAGVSAAAAAASAGAASTSETNAGISAAAAAASAATIPAYGALTGEALNYVRLNAGETAMEFRTPAEVLSDIGAQAYDANTAKLNVDQAWTGSQRGTPTTDNDLSFDLNTANNFTCTPSAGGTLTFTNHTAGQSGFIKLVNGSNYAIAAAATTKISAADLTKISATGTYLVSYYDDGTNTYCVASGNLA